MKFLRNCRGGILTYFAILLPILFAFMGLSIDIGLAYVMKGKLQDVADAAALAGAAHIEEDYVSFVKKYVEVNGMEVEKIVSLDSEDIPSSYLKVVVACGKIPKNDYNPEQVKVIIRGKTPLFFLRSVSDFRFFDLTGKASASVNKVNPDIKIVGTEGIYLNSTCLAFFSNESSSFFDGSIYGKNIIGLSYPSSVPKNVNMVSAFGNIFTEHLSFDSESVNRLGVTVESDILKRIRKFNGTGVLPLYGFNSLISPYKEVLWDFDSGNRKTSAKTIIDELDVSYKSVLETEVSYWKNYWNEKIYIPESSDFGKNRFLYSAYYFGDKEKGNYPVLGDFAFDKQYTNVSESDESIDTLFVAIRAADSSSSVKALMNTAWLNGSKFSNVSSINKIVVCVDNSARIESNLLEGAEPVVSENLKTGAFIIQPSRGIKFGSIYSEANLSVRGACRFNNGLYSNGSYLGEAGKHSFNGIVYSLKNVVFPHFVGSGMNKNIALTLEHDFTDAVIFGKNVLIGYDYSVSGNPMDADETYSFIYFDNPSNFYREAPADDIAAWASFMFSQIGLVENSKKDVVERIVSFLGFSLDTQNSSGSNYVYFGDEGRCLSSDRGECIVNHKFKVTDCKDRPFNKLRLME